MREPADDKLKPRYIDPIVALYMKDVDRTLIRHNLTLTVDQRFEQLMRLQELADELRRAGKEARLRR